MIPVCEPYLVGREKEYVQDCLDSNWISSQGKYIGEFEEKFAQYCGCKYGITTTSGTTALHLALATLGIGEGDEVIIPTFTMIATALAVIYTGAKPILVDCEPETYNINVDLIKEKITSRTKAIIPVHIYGHPCDMGPIMELALDNNLLVIEDAAEAHGAEYKNHKVGGLSHVGCFSFYANKIITCGEGGMVVTNNEEYAGKARSLRDLSHSKDKRFLHTDIGFNYRMTNIQAAIGLGQFECIHHLILQRRFHADLYSSALQGISSIKTPIEKKWAKNVYWMYAILVEEGRDKLMEYLRGKEIGTRTFFIPMHKQPVLRNLLLNGGSYPVANDISKRGLYLPSGSGLESSKIRYICDSIKEALE